MKIYLSKINSFRFFSKNKVSLEDRYSYMDGAIYGSKGISRISSVPCNRINAALGIFSAAADALLIPASLRQGTFLQIVPFELSIALVAYGLAQMKFNYQLPVPKDSVIDRMGYLPTNPKGSMRMVAHYMRNAFTNMSYGLGVYTGSFMVSHNPINLYAAFCLIHGAWQLRAARKLSNGAWTIQTHPQSQEIKKRI